MVPSKFCCLQHYAQSDLLIENALIEVTPSLVLCSRRKRKKEKKTRWHFHSYRKLSSKSSWSLEIEISYPLVSSPKCKSIFSRINLSLTFILFKTQVHIFWQKHTSTFIFLQKACGHFSAKTRLHFHLSSKSRCTCSGSKLTSAFIFLQKAGGRLLALHSRHSALERLVHLLLAVGVPTGTVVTLHPSCNRTNEHSV